MDTMWGINVREAAGQTVMHLHVRLIPRRFGDVASSRGGVRGELPSNEDIGTGRLRTRNESREPTADRNVIMPMTVWPRHKKRYTCSAFSTFEQAQHVADGGRSRLTKFRVQVSRVLRSTT